VDEAAVTGTCDPADWSVDYFSGTELAGDAVATDCMAGIDLAYASGDGPEGVGSTLYSARFTKVIDEGAGTYDFSALSDDGVRVTVDGAEVIDSWVRQSATTTHTGSVTLTAGQHVLEVEYFQRYGTAKLAVDYTRVATGCTDSQWSAQYYSGIALAGETIATECLTDLDRSYAAGDGPKGVGSTLYSARFTKVINEGAGTYNFSVQSDDGVRVTVDGAPVISSWVNQNGSAVHTGSAVLTEGEHVVVVEYYQRYGTARLSLDYQKVVTGCDDAAWSVDYFAGTDLAGAAVATDCVAGIDQSYADGVGPKGVGSTLYSARFTKVIDEGAGTYSFSARSDDGVRVTVDGEKVIDSWVRQSGTVTHTGSVALTEGQHVIVVEYFQRYGTASLTVDYEKTSTGCTAAQWSVDYFAGIDLAGSAIATDCMTGIDSTFAEGKGPQGVGSTLYSARFTKVIDEGAGTYDFSALSDDGVRVSVDGTRVIDSWIRQSATETRTGSVTLTEGQHVVVVEYFQRYGGAKLALSYEKRGVDVVAPGAPSELVASTVDATIRLDWAASAASDVAGYRVYRGTTPGVQTTGAPYSGADLLTTTRFVDSDAARGTTYYYAVVAVDGAGNVSPASNEAAGLVAELPDTEAPAAATALSATVGDGGVTLGWTASASDDAIGYRVYRATETGALTTGEVVSGAAPITAPTYLDDTTTAGTTYYYVVTVVDLAGNESVASNEVTAEVRELDVTAPAAPAGLSAQLDRSSVDLAWTAGTEDDIAGYRVYRAAGTEALAPISGAALLTEATFDDATGTLGTEYTYAVTAVDAAGNESLVSERVVATRQTFDIVVDGAGNGDAATIQGGIDLLANAKDYSAAPKKILVRPGTYTETVASGSRYGVQLIGATGDATDVVLTQAVGNTVTLTVSGKNWLVQDITVANTTTTAGTNGTALRTNQDRVVYDNVRLLGDKQTVQVSSGAHGTLARAYFVDSFIEGGSDVLIGRGTAVFDRVTFHIANRPGTDFTDASQSEALQYGFLITDSTVLTDGPASGAAPTQYLGRAYFEGATNGPTTSSQVTIRDTELGAAFRSTGAWRDYTGGTFTNTWTTERFFEYGNTGPGAAIDDTRPQLSAGQAADYTRWDYLRGTDGWNPTGTEEPAADQQAPAAPAGLVATAADRAVELDWADSTEADLDGYTVWRATGNEGFTPITTTPLTTSDYRDSAVTAGTEYRYRVTASDTAGNVSAESAEAAATPTGAVLPEHDALVASDGSGQYSTIQAAVDAVQAGTADDRTVILVLPGTYTERVTVTKSFVDIVGLSETATDTMLVDDVPQNAAGVQNLGATLVVTASNVTVRNLSVENAYDEALNGSSQALALYTTGDRLVFDNTRFVADQDTIQVNSPNVWTPARAYFVDSYIEGDVDFIYGRGTAVIDNSVIFASTRGSKSNNGYLTAASTSTTSRYGILITDSTVQSDAPADSFHLGRPWRAWTDGSQVRDGITANSRGQVTIRNTELSAAIKSVQPWTDMSPNLWTDGRFFEYANTGEGAGTDATRPQLTPAEAADYTKWDYLAGADGWNPTDGTEPVTDVTAPDAPASLTATPSATDSTVSLSWTSSTAADLAGYNVYRSSSATDGFTLLTETPVTESAFADTGLVSGGTVYYRVTAVDATGNESAAAEASAVAGGEVLPAHDVLVDPAGGAGTYATVQAALDAAPAGTEADPTVVLIRPGDYRGRVFVTKPYTTLKGLTGNAADVRIVFDLPSSAVNPDTGSTYGSSAATVMVSYSAVGVTMTDLTLENDYDENLGSSQALAIQTQADRGVFRNVRFVADQDTALFNSRNSDTVARSYVVDSYLEGDVDFIYGRGTVVVDRSTVHLSSRGSTSNNGYMLAPSTESANQYGILVTDSVVTSDAPDKSFYLGRPWKPSSAPNAHSQALIRDTVLPAAIRDDAWSDFGSASPWRSARLFEYNNSGPGAGVSADRPQLPADQANQYTRWTYLAGTDGWNPTGTPAPATDFTAPARVGGLTATPGNGTIDLMWATGTEQDLAGYRVYRSTAATVELTDANRLTDAPLATPGYTDRAAVAGTAMHYVVTAVDTSGNESVASAPAVATALETTLPPHDVLVDASGAGDFTTVQAAVSAVGNGTAADPKVIAIAPGTYREVVEVPSSYVTLVGGTGEADDVVIDYDNGASTVNPATGSTYGTSNSRTMLVSGNDVRVEDLTISNSYDEAVNGNTGASALHVTGDRLVFNDVRLLGNQNTVQVSTSSNTNQARAYFVDSYVEGDQDIIFGRGTAVFDDTEIHVTGRISTPYVTAARTLTTLEHGILITDSTITSDASAVYLGRPWTPSEDYKGQVLVRNTVLPASIRSTPWRDSSAGLDWKVYGRFAEYANTGAGAGSASADRPWLTAAAAEAQTKWAYLAGSDGWNPTGVSAPASGDVEAPVTPTGVSTTLVGERSVTVSWNPVSAEDLKGYVVYRSYNPSGSSWVQLTPQPITATSYVESSAGQGVTSYYRIVAVDHVGNASEPGTASIAVPAGTAGSEPVSVFVAGDSTASTYKADRAPRAGWGQALPLYLNDKATVQNYAISGSSTKTFIAAGALDKILAAIQPGDYLLISFGHNDEDDDPAKFTPLDATASEGSYQGYLMQFINGARDRGANPVIVTSVERRSFVTSNGVETATTKKTHKGYPEAAAALGVANDVPVLDLTSVSYAKWGELGPEGTKDWFMHLEPGESVNYPEGIVDNTHFQATGAIGVARMVANLIEQEGVWPAGSYTRRLGEDVSTSELVWPAN